MGPDVASVRQNLLPLVDDGAVNPTCATGGTAEWGSTIGQNAFVHRSGFGVTADGTEVYVAGPALSVCTLGRLLADAGVVRGMELDINPAWVSGTYFHDRPGHAPQGFPLFPAEQCRRPTTSRRRCATGSPGTCGRDRPAGPAGDGSVLGRGLTQLVASAPAAAISSLTTP